MALSNNIYDYKKISDTEYYFCTDQDVKYDLYFTPREDIPIDRLQLLYNDKLQLVEFGFDRYCVHKAEGDRRIFNTIVKIFETYPKENKLLFSYVFNPTGKNKELSKLYQLVMRRSKIEHITYLIADFKTSTDIYSYDVYYDDRLGIGYDDFIKEVSDIILDLFSNDNVIEYEIKEAETGNVLYKI